MSRVNHHRASPGDTELLQACTTLRSHAREWERDAALLRARIEAEICVLGETEYAARMHRQAAHLELCAALVRGVAGTDARTWEPPRAAPANGGPVPLTVLALLAVAGAWEIQADGTADGGRRAMLRQHAREIQRALARVPRAAARV
jgi:hypothetical protein